MKFVKKKTHAETEEYWQPATDIMVALLLVILLIMMLLLLYHVLKDNHKYDDLQTTSYSETTTDYDWTYPSDIDYDNDNGGGGDGKEDKTTTTTTAQAGGGNQDRKDDDKGKTAVLVSVIDAETGNIIKKKGILFELYAERDARGGLQALHTYYPVKVEYKQYETDKNGRFYLPEKIVDGWYSLHNLRAPEEYEIGGNTNFQITEAKDWNDPFLVSVLLNPARNIIKLSAIDADTKEPVPDSVYEVIVDEDILLPDGTVRLKAGKVVDTLTCDENGYAESRLLYVGKYRIRQKTAAEYYALSDTIINTEIKKSAVTTCVALCEKTKFIYTLTDAYTEEPIEGAVFIREDGKRAETDQNGCIVMTDLLKDQQYSLTLNQLPEYYKSADISASFKVSNKGLIKGEARYEFSATAYMIRFSGTVVDRLLRQEINGVNLTLYDQDGKVVANWDVDGTDHVIEGLEPGDYQLEVAGKITSRVTCTVKDTPEPQNVVIYVWTLLDFVLLGVGAAIVVVAVVGVIQFIRKKREQKKAKADEKVKADEHDE